MKAVLREEEIPWEGFCEAGEFQATKDGMSDE